jgi:D-sedoheptulose 7-phosphate isomerase
MRHAILQSVTDAIRAIELLKTESALSFIEQSARKIADCFQNGHKLLICGNGGSLCDATHFAEELSGFYREKRGALPAIALSESGFLTCVGNDIGYEYVFSRGVEALGKPGDLLAVLTTSGNSLNILHAIDAAKARGLQTIAFLGKTGGKLKGLSDLEWIVSGFSWSDRIQEAHMAAIHIIVEQIEHLLFAKPILSRLCATV